MEDRGPAVGPGGDGHLVQRAGAGVCAEHRHHGLVLRQAEVRAPGLARAAQMRAGHGPPDHLVLASRATVDRVREEHDPGKRCCKTIREAEMRIRLRQRRGDAAQTGGEHHRAGDVAAAAEHDVRPATGEDAHAGNRRARRRDPGLQERKRRPAWKPSDRERVELEGRLRNQLRLDAVGAAGERHPRAARAKCFRYCERGPDVPGGPPAAMTTTGCDDSVIHRDVKENADRGEQHDQRRAAVRDEGKRNPRQRGDAQDGRQVHCRLPTDERRNACREPLAKGIAALQGDAKACPANTANAQITSIEPISPSSSPTIAKIMSVWASGR